MPSVCRTGWSKSTITLEGNNRLTSNMHVVNFLTILQIPGRIISDQSFQYLLQNVVKTRQHINAASIKFRTQNYHENIYAPCRYAPSCSSQTNIHTSTISNIKPLNWVYIFAKKFLLVSFWYFPQNPYPCVITKLFVQKWKI